MVDDMIIEVWMFNSTGRWPQTVTAGEGEGEEEGGEKGGEGKTKRGRDEECHWGKGGENVSL